MTQPSTLSIRRGLRPPRSLISDAAERSAVLLPTTVPARYELRTSGPDATARKPIARASSAHAVKLLRRHESIDRQESLARPARRQVLAERQHVDVRVAQLPHRVGHFVIRFAQANHDAALGPQIGPQLLSPAAALASFVRTTPADRAPARSSRGTHSTLCANTASGMPSSKCCSAASSPAKIARQQFDRHVRQPIVHRLDASLVVIGPAVGQVVAIDDRDHDVREPHSLDRRGQLLRLARIGRLRIAERLDAAKPAAARAFFAGDHERRRAARPAIVQIRAASLFAHRVQPVLGDRIDASR